MNALITQLVLWQLALPLAIVLLHAILVPASMIGFVVRSVVIAMLLMYLALVGIWLFPPWWTPWAIAAVHLFASFQAYRLYARRTAVISRRRRTIEIGTGVLVGTLALTLLLPTLNGRRLPSDPVALAAPLETGTYLVTSGGTDVSINSHLAPRLADRQSAWRGQSRAVDLIAIDRFGQRASGISPRAAERYRIYGRRVLAPCDGSVVVGVDGVPDMPVPEMDRENMLGNHVILRCDGVHVVFAHLAPSTVSVSDGEAVRTGDELGRVGNSGNTAEPHLHMHVQRDLPPDEPISGKPLWFTIDGYFPLRNDRLFFS